MRLEEILNSNLTASEQKRAKRKIRIALAQKDFYLFCKALAPDFYTDNKPHLKTICKQLQALYEGRIWKEGYYEEDEFGNKIKKPKKDCEWHIAASKNDVPESAYVCKKYRMHIPPRHGKSRTLIYFECWCFGQNLRESVITVSYNSLIAEEFSRYVRDEIIKERSDLESIVFSDVFPKVQIKDDDASVTKWSLKGSHFSYLGTGMQGSTTSKGGTIQVVDDPVKDSVVAMNEIELEDQWTWFHDTFLSRTDAVGGESLLILNMTRWASKDLAGKIDEDPEERAQWFVNTMKVMNEETGEMLCEEILSRSKFYDLKRVVSTAILRANYFQEPIDIQGRLYKSFIEYDYLPNNIVSIREEVDPADSGKDYLCGIVYAETSDKMAYVLDILYDNRKVEYTLPLMCKQVTTYGVNKLIMESNSGGRLLANNLKSKLARDYSWYKTIIQAKPNSQNKISRINNMAEVVQTRIIMPRNWENRFDKFAKDVYKYISGGKNAHDDGPDCLTRVAERLTENNGIGAVNQGAYNTSIKATTNTMRPNIRVARVVRR